MKAVVIVSGGMDSVTLLYYVASMYRDVLALSFDYGQRHRRELECAAFHAKLLGVPHRVAALSIDGLAGSALTDATVAVPHGHYEAETMRKTVVPGRNAVMLSTAWAIGAAEGADAIAAGVHAGDHHIYPDCRPEFIRALESALTLGTRDHAAPTLHIEAPFLHVTKAEILGMGFVLGIDYSHTWTCYEGGALACGLCGACQERRGAFQSIGRDDPLRYASAA
jgi:7-cyano-7-deazaguanine synthase